MIYIILFTLIVFIDQITKILVNIYLKPIGKYNILKNFFNLLYVENRGVAFGLLSNNQIFITSITFTIILFLVFFMIKFKKSISFLQKIFLTMIIAGAVGNFIDRLRLSYVIDFISIDFGSLYSFPAFNIADISITLGALFLAWNLIFIDK